MAIHALIPAAGSGVRLPGAVPKQYRPLAGRPMLAWSLAAFQAVPEVDAVHVVLAGQDTLFDGLGLSADVLRVGGATRDASVLNGLIALDGRLGADDWVLVHDAARPGLTPALIQTLIVALRDDPVGGLLALPLADTLKRAAAGRSAETLPREGLWQAQTPQMFRYGLLRRALATARDAGRGVTDEASAIEALGLAPRLVPGAMRNFKVTWSEDLTLAESFLTRLD